MLNPQQEKVVRHHGRPLLVIAGAGSGKTKTLAHKVEFILEELGVPEDGVLCITFTNKAAKEIRERVLSVTGKDLPWIGTFHSVAYRLLRTKLGLSFTIADESDTREILKKVAEKFSLQREEIDRLRGFIARVKEDLAQPSSPELREIFDTYQSILRENGLFDFSDLLHELYLHLKKDSALRNELRENFGFILVDEYQDTNTVQYEIVKMLSRREVCVIGDPNQCIYEWRFARPDNILRFLEEFNPDVVKLERNYRSKGYILSVANAILRKSRAGWKDLVPTLRAVKDMGEKPEVLRFESEQEEALWVGSKIKELLNEYKPKDIAVLVRVSFVTDVFESTFFKLGIPYRVVGALRFYERPEVRNVLHFLRFLLNPSDELSFKRSFLYLTEGVGERTLQVVSEHYEGDWLKALRSAKEILPPSRAASVEAFLRTVERLKDLEYPQIIRRVLEETPFLKNLGRRFKGDFEERLENLRELVRTAEESFKGGASLEEFLGEALLVSSEEEEENAVSLMTIHAAKGLEFPVVFLPRLEEEILPHRSSLEEEAKLEEERRLFYVAVTRAKDRLFLSYTRGGGRKPSRFLSDIPKNLLNLEHFKKRRKVTYGVRLKANPKVKEGSMVNHRVFGVGRVLSVEGEKAQVDFRGKIKTIHTSFLETLD